MGQAIGEILPLAVVISLTPTAVVGVVLMLATPRGRSNGPAFIVGWIAGLAVVGTVLLVVAGATGAGDQGQPADWLSVVKLVLGGLLIALAFRAWSGRPRGAQEASPPDWMRAIDSFTVRRSTGLGVLLSVANPKNLLVLIGAVAADAQAGIGAAQQAVVLAVFIAIGTIGPAAPIVIYFTMGERSESLLEDFKTWLTRNSAAIMAAICLVIGAKLIGDGIAGLTS